MPASGCTSPDSSRARQARTCPPGVADHSVLKRRQAYGPSSGGSSAAAPPGRAVVVAYLDRRDRRVTRPRAALEQMGAGDDGPRAGHELRDAGRHEQRAREHPSRAARRRRPPSAGAGSSAAAAARRTAPSSSVIRSSHFTFVIPYQPGTSSRSGNPCCGGSGRAVQLVGEQHVGVERRRERQAAREGLLLAVLEAAVEAGEEHLDRAVRDAGGVEQVAQAARPASGPCRPPPAARAG